MVKLYSLLLTVAVLSACTHTPIITDDQDTTSMIVASPPSYQQTRELFDWAENLFIQSREEFTWFDKRKYVIYEYKPIQFVPCDVPQTHTLGYTCEPNMPVHYADTVYMDHSFYHKSMKRWGVANNHVWNAVALHEACHHHGAYLGINGDLRQFDGGRGDALNVGNRAIENFADACMGWLVRKGFEEDRWGEDAVDSMLSLAIAIGCDHTPNCTHGSTDQRTLAAWLGFTRGTKSFEQVIGWD